jgi:hypothetical protein
MERTAVGARELKTRLGAYLRRVREGRTLLVTALFTVDRVSRDGFHVSS